jgi:signal transduction histidine kinase
MTVPFDNRLDELTLKPVPLEELVDREALGELVGSFYELFRVPLRIFSSNGLMVEASHEPAIYRYLSEFAPGKRLVYQMIEQVKALSPPLGSDAAYECFTGAAYRVSSIGHDGRQIGRIVLGPYLPPTLKQVPRPLLELDGPDPQRVKELLAAMPRARSSTVAQIANHLQRNLDLILFSGHKALLTSSMHLASVRESYRDLEEKNNKLQEAYDQLRELDRLKSNFLATVSHELRTPLTSIIGFSEMLGEGIGGALTDDQREFVSTIYEKGQQLLELITDLLDLSKLESGSIPLKCSHVALRELVEDVYKTLTPQARKAGIAMEYDVPAALPTLWADGVRLRQVLLNLVGNAIKFTPDGGRVTLTAVESTFGIAPEETEGAVLFAGTRPALTVTVADTGEGVPDSSKSKIFDAFYQVDSGSTRQVTGTGLGLSIVKRLVDAHKGSINVRDNVGAGAVFVLQLPLGHPPTS